MLKRSKPIILLAVLALTLAACSSGGPSQPSQDQVRLDLYPIIAEKHAMTDVEIERLGLRRITLREPTVVFNHYRSLGKSGAWKYETLPAGTQVVADRNGRPWYKVDCANRLFVPSCPMCSGWWPFGGPLASWPWWLPWLLLPFLGGLLWWLLRRKWKRSREEDELFRGPLWHREPPNAATAQVPAAAAEVTDPTPMPAPQQPHRLTLAEAQDLCLRHIKLERAGIRPLYKRWDSGKISDDEFVASVEAILAD